MGIRKGEYRRAGRLPRVLIVRLSIVAYAQKPVT